MNPTPDVELVLRAYLADDGDIAPDRVLEVVADRIARQPRRPASRLPWRPLMNSYVKLAAGLAAILIVAVVAWQLRPIGDIGNPPSPAPSATAPSATAPSATAPSATAAPSASAPPDLPDGRVSETGTYRIRPMASAPSLALDLTVPAGWFGGLPSSLGGPVGESNGPSGIGITFLAADSIFSDPCQWNVNGSGPFQPGDVEVGPSVDELATALAASPAYVATTPSDVTIGGFAGKRLEFELPAGDCDTLDGNGVYIVFGARDGYFYAQGDGSHWEVTILDVDGTRLIAALFSYAGTSAADLSAGQEIIDSLVITP
jgi:hypothetical protein